MSQLERSQEELKEGFYFEVIDLGDQYHVSVASTPDKQP